MEEHDSASGTTSGSACDTESTDGEGMFDMFTQQLKFRNAGARPRIINLDAYHRELEAEFGDGAKRPEVLLSKVSGDGDGNRTESTSDSRASDNDAEDVRTQRARPLSLRSTPRRQRPPVDKAQSLVDCNSKTLASEPPPASTCVNVVDVHSSLVVSGESLTPESTDFPSQQRTFGYEDSGSVEPHHPWSTFGPPQELYQYSRLSDNHEIRVLDILPATAVDEPIQCQVRTLSLLNETHHAEHRYQTVSYAWGESHDDGSHLTHAIWCDGKLLHVTASLHAAVQMIRGHMDSGNLLIHGTRPAFWADAVCIGQGNLQERNHQVNMMAKIYSKSSRVLVWLGEALQGDDERLVKLVTAASERSMSHSSELSETAIEVVRSVLQRQWFKRRWVIPEFALQAVRTVLYGRYAIDCQSFIQLLRWARLSRLAGPMDHTRLWNGLRTKRWLLANLHRFSHAECSVPLDLIFALVSISCGCGNAKSVCGESDCGSRYFPVDYQADLDQLFLSLAKRFAECDVVALLACASVRRALPAKTSTTMPSWVPDWRLAPTYGTENLRAFIDECFQEYDTSQPGAYFTSRQPARLEGRVASRNVATHGLGLLSFNGWLFERSGLTLFKTSYYLQQRLPAASSTVVEAHTTRDVSDTDTADDDMLYESADQPKREKKRYWPSTRMQNKLNESQTLLSSSPLSTTPRKGQVASRISKHSRDRQPQSSFEGPAPVVPLTIDPADNMPMPTQALQTPTVEPSSFDSEIEKKGFASWIRGKVKQQKHKDARAGESKRQQRAEYVWESEKFRGDWPEIEHNQAVCLLPRSRLAFVLSANDSGSWTLCSCFRRPIVLGNGRFLWIQESTGQRWLSGDLRAPLHTIEIG